MTKKTKGGASLWLTLIYGLFTLLYTVYISMHIHPASRALPGDWWYYLKFLLIDAVSFFILQGLLLKSKNWGILLLLPLCILAATIIVGYIFVWILRWGGGDLLDRDRADMIFACLLFLSFSYFSLRFIDPKGKGRRR